MRLRRITALALALWVVLGIASTAHAHPLGNFTTNRFSGIEVTRDGVRIHYVVDLAEIPTLQELADSGVARGATPPPAVLDGIAEATGGEARDGVTLRADDKRVALGLTDSSATLRPGQGGLDIMRIELLLSGRLTDEQERLEYVDDSFAGRIGWKEVVAYATHGQGLASASVPVRSVSDELRNYPRDLLSSPLDDTTASLRTSPDAPGGRIEASDRSVGAPRELAGSWFTSLIKRDLSPAFLVVALLLSIGAGALHALGPGHGKTITAAYLVGAGGRVRHAMTVGIAVSLMHTASVVALGLITLWASSLFPPESVYPWLSLASGVVVLALGTWLLTSRLRARRAESAHHDAHTHDLSHGHSHHHPPPEVSPFSAKGMAAVAVSGGLLPSPAALVVLLGAVALHRVGLGIALVAGFSVGLAGALTAVGVLVLKARNVAARRFGSNSVAMARIASAAAIVVMGTILTARAAVGF